jgi:DNA-binding response OmpR family regulator
VKILVVGSSPLPAKLLNALQTEYALTVNSLSKKVLNLLADNQYDLVLVWSDQLTFLTIKKFLKLLYRRFPDLKVLILGKTYTSPQRAALLMMGVKDCVSGKICPEELIAKIKIVVRNGDYSPGKRVFRYQDFSFDFRKNSASHQGKPVELNKKEIMILRLLIKRKNTVLTKQTIYRQIWENIDLPNSNSLEVHISSIRRKIGPPFADRFIETVSGMGYRLNAD